MCRSRKFPLCLLAAVLSILTPCGGATIGTFTNPIITDGADPWVIFKDGIYYYTQTTGGQVKVRKSSTISGLGSASATTVFTPSAPYNQDVWAPELHFLNNKWYVYFASDDGTNDNHRIYAAEANTSNPQGAYTLKGKVYDPANDRWAIDPTVFQASDGSLYMIWSGWPGAVNVVQNLYIAPMSNPWTISGPRVLLSTPTLDWETKPNTAAPLINEGPEVLTRNGKTYIVYSANKSWQDHYCLGLLVNTNGNFLNPSSWTKYPDPVFFNVADETGTIYSPGHCSFTRNAAQTEDWIVYHAAKYSGAGFDRSVRIQPFGWTLNDFPMLGRPIVTNLPVAYPLGEAPSSVSINPNVTNGFAQADVFTDIAGTSVSVLTNNAKYPAHPDFSRFAGQLELPRGTGWNYGARVFGFVIPPTSGSYVFYVASSSESRFSLSTNDSPDGLQLLCREPIGSTYRNWTSTVNRPNHENTSATIQLQAGASYYFEAIVKAGASGTNDHFGACWKLPGGATPVAGAAPIPGSALAFAFDGRTTVAPVITQQPTNNARYATMTGSLAVASTSTVMPWFQWQQQAQTNDWRNLAGGYDSVLSFPSITPTNAGTYRVVVRNPAGIAVSSNAVVTVHDIPRLAGTADNQGGGFSVSLPAYKGFTFALEATTNFTGWITVGTTNPPTDRTVTLHDPAGFPQRFYRINVR
jgi:GH43 family beta-xylosidase